MKTIELELEKIIYDYYIDIHKDKVLANKEYNNLWYLLDTDTNYQLISYGKIVFLLKFQNNKVEFHSMGKEDSAFAFANDIRKLIKYVKELGVDTISTYGNNKIFEQVAKRLKLNIKQELDVGSDGLTYNYYKMEL